MPIEDAGTLLPLMWSPLTVVTAADGGRRGGQIAVGAFTASIVPERPRVLVEIQKRNHTHGLIAGSGGLAVHLLAREQWRWVRHWGFRSQGEVDKFEGVGWREGPRGLPILEGVLGWLACEVVNAMDGGDMTIFLADVFDAERNTGEQPIRWHEVQQMLPEEWRAEYGRKLAQDVPDSARRMGEFSEGAGRRLKGGLAGSGSGGGADGGVGGVCFGEDLECCVLDLSEEDRIEGFSGYQAAALDGVCDERLPLQSQSSPIDAGFALNPCVIAALEDQRTVFMERLAGPMRGEIGQSDQAVFAGLAEDDPEMVRVVVAEERGSRRGHRVSAARRL